ncbi:hypothetical protein F3Y22_tig00111708pilonHSYRG00199 [Hibiscus syriacus]|uniref:Uncharacterized protein n=1 Tax=Hibiscus syriacus TaxID=106335 RepID=A0A6A2XXK8_HIBSY|nr:hypothetical protein F3Y22_tig00111708pilonHSYRG00199 [Hibiscus syriacus]
MPTRAFVLLLVCFLVLHGVCGCVSGHECSYEKPSLNRKADLKVDDGSTTGAWNRESFRMVPSGPDPLHHNGGSPKKPRTDP